MENTQDLSKLGYREIAMLAELLKLYSEGSRYFESREDWEEFGHSNGVKWEYNPKSDNLFLIDEDYNTLMLNSDGKLESWLNCSYCGAESFRGGKDQMATSPQNGMTPALAKHATIKGKINN